MKRIVTGIKPTGELTLGNYVGVINALTKLQDEYEIILFVADLHAITTRQDRLNLRKLIKEHSALYIACGIDPSKVKIFIQSEIIEHAQLGYILTCNSYVGELNRMTQYKDKVAKEGSDSLTGGFYIYPSLMAADILIYDADYVYVGQDQLQHLELTRTLAIRFNNAYGDTFKVPESMTNHNVTKVMDLQLPNKKMSKSANNKGCILLTDSLAQIKNKILSAKTDSDNKIIHDKANKAGISNLIEIYSVLTDLTIKEVETKYQTANYESFKKDLAEVVVNQISDIQDKYQAVIKNGKIDEVFDEGYEYCRKIAIKKLQKVEHKVGLNRKK